MKYRVTHKTSYEGHETVSVGHNQAWLEFRMINRQQVESFLLTIEPEPSVRSRRMDAFGNPVHIFSFNEGYQRLDVIATTTVTVRETEIARDRLSHPWEDVVAALKIHATPDDRAALEFAFPSHRIASSAAMREYAAQ